MDDQLRNSKLLPLLRERIREVLVSSAAFRALPPDKRTQIAHDTVRTLHFILGGGDGNSRPDAVMLTGNTGGFAPAEADGGATPAPKLETRPPGIGEVARSGNASRISSRRSISPPSSATSRGAADAGGTPTYSNGTSTVAGDHGDDGHQPSQAVGHADFAPSTRAREGRPCWQIKSGKYSAACDGPVNYWRSLAAVANAAGALVLADRKPIKCRHRQPAAGSTV